MIGPKKASIGDRPHMVQVQTPGPSVLDGDGGFTTPWTDALPVTWYVAIQPATGGDLERAAGGTAITSATHVISGPYRADITTHSRLRFNGRIFEVAQVTNPEERSVELVLICKELVTPAGLPVVQRVPA